MSKEAEQAWQDATNLMTEAARVKLEGADEEAIKLADKAVALVAAHDLDTYHWEILRETTKHIGVKNPDYTKLIEISQKAAARFQKEGNVARIIDTLGHLVSFLANAGEKQEAQKYLRQLEDLLVNVNSDDLAQYIPQRFLVTSLESKKRYARRLREFVDSL